jgi:iron-sulfur cluster repair protein YtfE (RIC family)
MKTIENSFEHADEGTTCELCGAPRVVNTMARIPKPLLQLQKEHKTILRESRSLLAIVGQITRKAGNRARSAKQAARNIAILEKLVVNHLRNEERILLPVMSKYFDSDASKIIHHEHREISGALKEMRNKMTEIDCSRAANPVKDLVKSITDFDSMARSHFSREENVIYWFASLCLSQPDCVEEIHNLHSQ